MSLTFRMFEHLLPRSKTWRFLLGKQLREFFEGLANGVPTDLIAKADARFTDTQPVDTTQLPGWDEQFGLPLSAGLSDAERRLRLAAAWAEAGGQGLPYLEGVLHDQGFPDAFLHEFWEPGLTTFATDGLVPEDDGAATTAFDFAPTPTAATINLGFVSGGIDSKFSGVARFALDIPKDSRIIAAELRVTVNGMGTAGESGQTFVGRLTKDAKWNVIGGGFKSPEYASLIDIPSPTENGTSEPTPGVLENDRFIPGAVWDWVVDDLVDGQIFSVGHKSFDPTSECDLAAEIQAHIDDESYDPVTAPYIGFAWDNASDAVQIYGVYMSDDAVEEGPHLTVIWEPVAVQPLTVKNPNTYLEDGGPVDSTCCDEPLMECGEVTALCGETVGARGSLLVNIVEQSATVFLGCGDPEMECDEALALCGEALSVTFSRLPYLIPVDVDEWRYILYVGAEVWPQVTSVDLARQEEFESLLLRICPGQQWLGMLVDYS